MDCYVKYYYSGYIADYQDALVVEKLDLSDNVLRRSHTLSTPFLLPLKHDKDIAVYGTKNNIYFTQNGKLFKLYSKRAEYVTTIDAFQNHVHVVFSSSDTGRTTIICADNSRKALSIEANAWGQLDSAHSKNDGLLPISGETVNKLIMHGLFCSTPRQLKSNCLSCIEVPFKSTISSVCCGVEHILVLTYDGKVLTSGNGSRAQLGLDDIVAAKELTLVEYLLPLKVTAVASGGWHNVVLSDCGDLYGWGWNESGQVGAMQEFSMDVKTPKKKLIFTPTLVDTPLEERIDKISTGYRHSAAITKSGSLFTWGWNGYGQLCVGDQDNRDKPTKVEFFEEQSLCISEVYCGDWYTLVASVTP